MTAICARIATIAALKAGLLQWFENYNCRRPHASLGGVSPAQVHGKTPLRAVRLPPSRVLRKRFYFEGHEHRRQIRIHRNRAALIHMPMRSRCTSGCVKRTGRPFAAFRGVVMKRTVDLPGTLAVGVDGLERTRRMRHRAPLGQGESLKNHSQKCRSRDQISLSFGTMNGARYSRASSALACVFSRSCSLSPSTRRWLPRVSLVLSKSTPASLR